MRTVATEARLRSMLAHPVRQVAMHHIAKLCAQHTRTQQVMARATSILSTSASHTEPELSTTMSESVVPLFHCHAKRAPRQRRRAASVACTAARDLVALFLVAQLTQGNMRREGRRTSGRQRGIWIRWRSPPPFLATFFSFIDLQLQHTGKHRHTLLVQLSQHGAAPPSHAHVMLMRSVPLAVLGPYLGSIEAAQHMRLQLSPHPEV